MKKEYIKPSTSLIRLRYEQPLLGYSGAANAPEFDIDASLDTDLGEYFGIPDLNALFQDGSR